MRPQQEQEYWNKAALDPKVDEKFISDIPAVDFIKFLKPRLKPGSLLDVGCGVGRLTIPLAEKSRDFVHGIDSSAKMLEIANDRGSHLKNIMFRYCSGRSLPYRNDFFDNVICVLVFQHLPFDGVVTYIHEAYRVLKPRGRFIFQIIEGTEDEPFSKHHSIRRLGLAKYWSSVMTEPELIHKQWTWITAEK